MSSSPERPTPNTSPKDRFAALKAHPRFKEDTAEDHEGETLVMFGNPEASDPPEKSK